MSIRDLPCPECGAPNWHQDQRSTAYHETGHNVVRQVIGRYVHGMSIRYNPEKGQLGRSYFEDDEEGDVPPVDDLAEWAAGEIAETMQLRRAGVTCEEAYRMAAASCEGENGDRTEARRQAMAYARGDEAKAERLLAAGRGRAEQILSKHWRYVEAVVAELMEFIEVTNQHFEQLWFETEKPGSAPYLGEARQRALEQREAPVDALS
jgi:hypothetical protein